MLNRDRIRNCLNSIRVYTNFFSSRLLLTSNRNRNRNRDKPPGNIASINECIYYEDSYASYLAKQDHRAQRLRLVPVDVNIDEIVNIDQLFSLVRLSNGKRNCKTYLSLEIGQATSGLVPEPTTWNFVANFILFYFRRWERFCSTDGMLVSSSWW